MSDIKKTTINGFKWVGIYSLFNMVINPISIVLLGMLLSQQEFGQRAIIAIIVSIASTLAQFGIAQAIIQAKSISKKQLDSLFWVHLFFGCILFLIVYFSADLVAIFYGDPTLIKLIQISSFIFLMEPVSAVFIAYLEKNLFFKAVTLFNVIKLLITNTVMLLLAYLDFGASSFVYGILAGVVIYTSIVFMYFSKNKIWLPSFEFNLKSLKPFYSFGIYVTGKNILNIAGKDFDEIIIGKILGLEVLGIYSFAKQLIEKIILLVSSTVSKVTYPIYSKVINQVDGTQKFKSIYLQLTSIVAFLGFPIFGLLFLILPPSINLIFKGEWESSIIIMQILAIKGMIDILSAGFASSALYSYNKPNWVFYTDLLFTPLRIGLITIGAYYSIEAVAIIFVAIVLLKSTLLQLLVNKVSFIKLKSYVYQIIRPLIIANLLTLSYFFAGNISENYLDVIITSLVYISMYLCLMLIFNQKFTVNNIMGLRKILLKN